jgi:hypothetical protein
LSPGSGVGNVDFHSVIESLWSPSMRTT